jgi:hypothetical protein
VSRNIDWSTKITLYKINYEKKKILSPLKYSALIQVVPLMFSNTI